MGKKQQTIFEFEISPLPGGRAFWARAATVQIRKSRCGSLVSAAEGSPRSAFNLTQDGHFAPSINYRMATVRMLAFRVLEEQNAEVRRVHNKNSNATAMKTFNRTILGAHWMGSALLLSGFVLCNFGAQADVPYSKIGWWSVAYLEVDKVSGCRAAAQSPDQTVFQMAQIQSGTDKAWIIFISNPRWNAWIGKRKELRLQLVTDWPTTKPWPYKFSISGDSKILSTTDASVEFMNSVADASKVEIKDDNGALWTTVDMKDSAAAIRAIVNCVREHPPGDPRRRRRQYPELVSSLHQIAW